MAKGRDSAVETCAQGAAAELNAEQKDPLTRLNAILQADDSKVALIKDLIQETEKQREKLTKLELELEDEKDSKAKWRGRFLENSKETEKAASHPYVVLLIDGDGMIFSDNYLLHPQGGQLAATALLQQTREVITNSSSCTPLDNFEIVIRVFGNVNGLSETLDQIRGIKTDIKNFVVGFSQSKSLVDFVDVGWGKEMADSKIFGELRFHLSNYNCKHVILGASHDNGYARILGSLVVEGVDSNRVMLLEGVPFAREFKNLPFKKIKFSNIFLSQRLPNPASQKQQQSSQGRPGQGQRAGQATDFQENIAPPPPYGYISGIQESLSSISQLAPNTHSTIYPPPIPRPPAAILQRINAIKPTPCFAYYLSRPLGGGCASDKCGRSHVAITSPEGLQGLAYIAQGTRCKNGPACTKPHCFYGHQCQIGACKGKQCMFKPEEHAPGTYQPSIANDISNIQAESSASISKTPDAEEQPGAGTQKSSKGQKKRPKKRGNTVNPQPCTTSS